MPRGKHEKGDIHVCGNTPASTKPRQINKKKHGIPHSFTHPLQLKNGVVKAAFMCDKYPNLVQRSKYRHRMLTHTHTCTHTYTHTRTDTHTHSLARIFAAHINKIWK